MFVGMQAGDGFDGAALERLMAGSGVNVAAEEIEAVGRSLARIRKAAATLSHSTSFDTTIEQFFRLLESGAAGRTGA